MDSTVPTAAPFARRDRLINRDFRLLWVGQTISNLGDYVFDTTLVLWIANDLGRGQSWAPVAVSGVLLAAALPALLIGPLAGVFVDRWDRRRTMLWMDALRALLIALLLPLALGPFSTSARLAATYMVVALATACAQFFGPARMALIGDIVPEEQRGHASALSQITSQLALIVGMALAAPLYFGLGIQWALWVNAASFVVSFLAVLAVRPPRIIQAVAEAAGGGFRQDLLDGLRVFAASRVLTTLLIAVIVVMLGGGALNALDYFFVTGNLHAPAHYYSLVSALFAVGALAGAVLGGVLVGRIGAARLLSLSLVAAGVLLLFYSRLSSLGPGIAVLFLTGMPASAVNLAAGPLMLHAAPRTYIGRVSAVINTAATLASMLSILAAGALASTLLRGFHATALGMRFGPIDSIFTAAGLLILLGGIYATANLRGVRLAGEDGAAERAPAAAVGVD